MVMRMALLAKLFYSVLLLGLTAVLIRELWIVWFDKTIYIGQFDLVSEAENNDSSASSFSKRIVSAQAILRQQFLNYQTKRSADSPSDATYILPGMKPLLLPPEVLAGVDITVQNVNLRQIFSTIRKFFLAPNEITGRVTKQQEAVLAVVDWPGAPKVDDPHADSASFIVPGQPNEQAAAAYIASAISWARAASQNHHVAVYPRAQFCDFGAALNDYFSLGEKASSSAGLDETAVKSIRARCAQLRAHYRAEQVFPEIFRLRADLLDLLPETQRKLNDLVDSQEDRLRYAMLSPKLQNLSNENKRLAALALARPAIPLGQLAELPENWKSILDTHTEQIDRFAKSVGTIKHRGQPIGTGFIVGPGLMIAMSFTLEGAGYVLPGQQSSVLELPAESQSLASAQQNIREKLVPQNHGANQHAVGDDAVLCLGQSPQSPDPSIKMGKIVAVGDGEIGTPRVVLVELIDHDLLTHPPLPVSETPATAALIGKYC
jgi:hypothetical protein